MLLPVKNKDAQRLVEWVEYGMYLTLQLSSSCTNIEHELTFLLMTLPGVHDAVTRQYLETMSFGVSRDAAQTDLLEEFTFNFSYDNPGTFTMTDQHDNIIATSMSQSSQVSPLVCSLSCCVQVVKHGRLPCEDF